MIAKFVGNQSASEQDDHKPRELRSACMQAITLLQHCSMPLNMISQAAGEMSTARSSRAVQAMAINGSVYSPLQSNSRAEGAAAGRHITVP
jgi:hypothetical protein